MLPENTYAAVVAPVKTERGPLSIQFGPATEKSPFVAVLSFEIIRGPYAGQTITAFLHFGERSIQRSMESLRICGFTGDDIDRFSDQSPDNEVSLEVEHETYDGKMRARVKWINDPARGAGYVLQKPLDPGAMRRLGAQLKLKLKAVPPINGKKAVREAPTAMPEPAAAAHQAADNGWSGNDEPVPPTDLEYEKDTKADGDDIPF